ncbi:MAG: LysR family transcriptional regulator [Betaproteobacteria bacterium]
MSKTDNEGTRAVLPLNSIRVFVEAARQLSFSRAAQSLGITQSGVSHHVASLENYVGQALFQRIGSSVTLTNAGRLYFDTVHEAVSTLELSTRQFRQRADSAERLVIRTSLYTFATSVLIPALPRFCPTPAVSVDVITSLSPPAKGDIYDVLITRDLVIEDDAHWLLATEELICVAAPSILREFSGKPISSWPFITTRSRPDVLSTWANRTMIDSQDVHAAATFEHYFLALPAALGGMGFLVIPRLLVADHLQQGRLLETEHSPVRTTASYKAYINPHTTAPEVAKAFCRWLNGQLKSDIRC